MLDEPSQAKTGRGCGRGAADPRRGHDGAHYRAAHGGVPGDRRRAYILQTGRLLMQGKAEEIKVNPDVRKAYLGL
jgi:hypothetical protein